MKLAIAKVERNQDNEIVKESPVDMQAILADREKLLTSALATDTVHIESIYWNIRDGIFQVHFSLGGIDQAGVYHRNPNYRIETEIWGRTRTPALWARYNLESIKNISFDDVIVWLFRENAVHFAIKDKWQLPASVEVKVIDDTGKVAADYKRGSRRAKPGK